MKKLIALFLVMAASLLVFTIPASAGSDDSGIAAHYDLCDCGGSIVNRGTNWNNVWIVIEELKCSRYNYGTDIIFQDSGIQTWQCIECKKGTTWTVTRTKKECHGYDVRTANGSAEEVDCTHYCYGTDLVAANETKDCHGYDPK